MPWHGRQQLIKKENHNGSSRRYSSGSPSWPASTALDDLRVVENESLIEKLLTQTTTLETYPPNYSASLPGLNLGNGHNVTDQPVFYRVGRRDRALLFALPEHSTVSQQAQPATPTPSVSEKKQPKSPVKSDKQKQPDKKWSVGSEHVLGFIDWLSEKEKAKEGFKFNYNINNNTLNASSIEAAARQYNWPARTIPNRLIGWSSTWFSAGGQ